MVEASANRSDIPVMLNTRGSAPTARAVAAESDRPVFCAERLAEALRECLQILPRLKRHSQVNLEITAQTRSAFVPYEDSERAREFTNLANPQKERPDAAFFPAVRARAQAW
jgi:hypothetical protein